MVQFSKSFQSMLLLFLILLCFLFHSVLADSITETWDVPNYQKQDYAEFYAYQYFSPSLEDWNFRVEEMLAETINSWIAEANERIESILANETDSDFYISNEGYLDERRRSLVSEVSILYAEWERDLFGDYFENRDAFLLKLETGKVDQMYLERIGKETIYEEYTKEELLLIENREKIIQSAKEWEFEWEKSKQEGLDAFSTSLELLKQDYENYLLKMKETEDRFQTNLTAISEYKETVKGAISNMVSQLRDGLEVNCNLGTGCQYKNLDGSLNEAGKVLSKLISELSSELISSNENPDSILTFISTKIQNFLSMETNQALAEHKYFENRIYTYQTGLNINLDQTKSSFDLGFADWILRTQLYHALSQDQKYENWRIEGEGNVGNFSKIHDPFLRAIFQSIHHSDESRLVNLINEKLGPGRRVSAILGSNLYTDVHHFLNNDEIFGVPIPFDSASHVNGNLLSDGNFYYAYWKMERTTPVFPSGTFYRQMGAIGYSVLYEMYDEVSSNSALYWNDNYHQLNSQNNYFQNRLLPAIGSWESKVKQYADDFQVWSDAKENLKYEAKTNLIANIERLEASKENWLSQLEREKKEGDDTWLKLYEKGETTQVNPIGTVTKPNEFLVSHYDEKELKSYEELSNWKETKEVFIGEQTLLSEFHRTITGVNQYANVLQMNSDLEALQKKEQTKLLNQMVYSVNQDLLQSRSLTKDESILVGNYDYQSLTVEEQKKFGLCYENPNLSECNHLLKKQYEIQINHKNQNVTIRKEIYDGQLAGKNEEGEYTASKIETNRHFQLSQIGKIQSSDRKDFFVEWSDEDWNLLAKKKNEISNQFLTKSLANDQLTIASNIQSIEFQNQRNVETFYANKEKKENQDSLVQEIVLAYLGGGTQGIKASMQGKIESAINSELAKVWIQASGGSEADIQKTTMAIEFMRGRLKAKKIQSRDNFVSIQNPMSAIETVIGKSISHGMQFLNHSTGGIYTIPINFAIGGVVTHTKSLVGEKRYDALKEQISGRHEEMAEVKANEAQLAKTAISNEIASITGIEFDIMSKVIEDQYNQKETKKAKRRKRDNGISDLQSKSIGAYGGMIKTAMVATGINEGEIVSLLEDTNQLINARNINPDSKVATYYRYTEQGFGMVATGTQYQSAFLDYTDAKTLVTELGKQALAKEISQETGMDESFLNEVVGISYGNREREKANQKAKSKATRQSVVNAISLAITMGASGALTGVNSALSTIGKAASFVTKGVIPATVKMGQVISTTIVQTVAGSHEGPNGAAAGFANGVLGGMIGEQTKFQSGFLKGLIPALGVKYSAAEGWGGIIGIGNSINNFSLSVSEKGNSSLQVSKSLGDGIQFSGDFTSNQAWNVGIQYNPKGEGPRKDWNYSMMYDLKGSGFSGSIGYTDPESGIGLTANFDQTGMSTSSELNGVSVATFGNNGFQLEDYDFANQNINLAQDLSDSKSDSIIALEDGGEDTFSDLLSQLSMLGGFAVGGMGLVNLLRNRQISDSNQFNLNGNDLGNSPFQVSANGSVFGRIADKVKSGFFNLGTSIGRFFDSYKIQKPLPQGSNATNTESTQEADRITKLKTKIIDDYKKDSRLDTEKKLYELKQAGVDTTEIEAKIKALRGGKDVPMSKAVQKSLNEYKRLRESRSIQPIGTEAVVYLTSEVALTDVKVYYDPKAETKQAYFQRLGEEICEATKKVDLSSDELVALHTANVAKLLGENLKSLINYGRYVLKDGKEDVSGVNTVNDDGFRQITETDCIRYIGAVLHAAGLTDRGGFANLNSDVFLTPEEMERMDAEYKAGLVHQNGVEFFRQAGGFSKLVSERLTTEKDLNAHKEKGVIPELKVGMIGITRKMELVEGTKKEAMKSDHIYIVIGKKFNPDLGVNEYLISESAGGAGIQNRWITLETKSQISQILEEKYLKAGKDKKASKELINKALKDFRYVDYLPRSEYYELIPQKRI
ncbi:TIGR04388 family protein [Leptospira jelokensis]|uniref:TIGR04388 family protein n=1 Tax=Leptospira jelokensis TaxID=2484931 RepID=UPI001091822F|nr:TIGR04388 family protein [Leptospira jelokensis]TGM01184.1 TIGR04388 family protein [Leptospira jelokensis]